MRRLTQFALAALLVLSLLASRPLAAQVTVTGGVIVAGGSGGGTPCATCALLPAANIFQQTNTFQLNLLVSGTVNGLSLAEDNLSNIGLGNQSITPGQGSQNLGVGDFTLAGATGQGDTALGYNALDSVAAGSQDTGVGQQAAPQITSGNDDTAAGASSLASLTTGTGDTAIGYLSLSDVTTQGGLVAVGAEAGSGPSAPGQFPNLSNGVYLGYQAAPASAGTYTNQIVIGYTATGSASNQTTLGNPSITTAVLYGTPTFPQLGGFGSGCVGINNSGVFSVVPCGGGSSAFSALTGGTNSSAAMIVGTGASLAVTGAGTIAATTAAALAGTPTLCSAGSAPTGILPSGNATGCQAIGGGGGGGAVIQTNGVNNSSQTVLNHVNTTSVLWTNPSGGVESATVPTATPSTLGISSPDNTTLAAAAGVLSIKSPGPSTILGFNGSSVYTGFSAGTNISFSGGLIADTNPANTVSTAMTSGTFPVATGTSSQATSSSGLSQAGSTLTWAPGSGSTILGSGTSSNVDGWGELAAAGTTVSYTFINTYTSHPECVAEPQANPGGTHWITYTGATAFTIHFATSYTGQVTYHCDQRN